MSSIVDKIKIVHCIFTADTQAVFVNMFHISDTIFFLSIIDFSNFGE